jgi:hypothetical protein
MRPLTEDESKLVFTKLANYIVCILFTGPNSQFPADRGPGQESRASHRPSGRDLLFQTAQRPGVLCPRTCYAFGSLSRPAEPHFSRNLLWQILKERQI